ncbi:MAG: ATP-dependent DNA helicase PcrA [Candidatus Daviesbacteria bacterium GW2011_GWA1_41_61]|uniref:DNA 3'-5' helicase n=1 Tax=Candidatus Daviesbacteria bacterium GW2011_GWA2_40_9 TaxID=1618424 RepID=A0A0G0U2X1_9BACT|nr:MAG: ATP-dependent DNA helicase PcrA [Candidatus Daviesbacteria bacterium GW2011_GWC1_40_9]KKR83444.1 MAG: ATP-dependent DNA helicase PcrA [Candidatus Daviesbacteria bacterium GW2011_GWA2_40_9]KKR93826.1 MAG: ATP-dependent DNA helicase PcrA [Candidatus Daviesbacteria bacterium GW2011_GWB1_41_15]KKS15292.1 MAG: ATP-dependent DNA helicase PcrA [Candidatus Daviesbacteria bacterium GW2011_GWA1_41_61]
MLSNLLDDLNPVQKEAVKATEGPTLIMAGAGSGKTKALTHRVAYLIKEKAVPPENICVLTFTNKASDEMKGRIIKLLSYQPKTSNLPTMGTFHFFCARILRKDGHLIGLPPSFSIYDEHDALDAIKEAMKHLDLSPQKSSPSGIKNTISQAKNEMISSLEYPQYARGYYQETVAKIYLEYQKILEKNKAVDFDDLLLLTVKLFQTYPEVLSQYQLQFRYILIDEYQDTNTVQYLLSKLLAHRYKNICVVGDASQSIYMFRGADFRNIVNFQRDYPGARVFNLEQNYRSTQIILDAAFAVISKNNSHPILKLWTNNPPGEKIEVVETRNEEEEALFIVSKIKKFNFPLSSCAVLYRTNAQSRSLEEIFLKAGVPYILVGGIRFYERKEIKDILAYLRLLANSEDSISKNRIEKIGKTRANRFRELFSETLTNYTTLELLDLILQKTDYLDYLDDGADSGKSRIENVKELRSVAQQYPNLIEFLENVALVESEYSSDEKLKRGQNKKETVTLTTLHQAKGLEWPMVFIVGMEEGLFPHSRSLLNPNELEEERRLCYVGITRAKERLFLTYTRQRLYFGTRSNNLVSRFVIDLPEELINSATNYQDRGQFLDDVTIDQDQDEWLNV